MSDFTVRVELHNANSDDYYSLHEKMESNGYSREIKGSDGNFYKLPTAEYTCSKSKSTTEIRDEVKVIAESVKRNADVLVTKSDGRAWSLTEV